MPRPRQEIPRGDGPAATGPQSRGPLQHPVKYSLRLKAIAGIGGVLALLILLFYWQLSLTLDRNFGSLQADSTTLQVNRVLQSLQQSGTELSALLYNYSSWDVTYSYPKGENPSYWEDNYMPLVFSENRLDYVLVFDTAGKYYGGRAYDRETGETREPEPEVTSQITPDSSFLVNALAGTRETAFVDLPRGVLHAAARPILTDYAQGPATGVIVFARYLDAVNLEGLKAVSGMEFNVHGNTGAEALEKQTPDTLRESKLLDGRIAWVSITPGENGAMRGYAQLRDIDSRQRIGVSMELPAPIHLRAEKTQRNILVLTIGCCTLLALVALGLVELLVLRPLRHMEREVVKVTDAQGAHQRLNARTRDEFGALAGSVNHMLDTLEETEHRFSMLAEVSPVGMFSLDEQGQCAFVNSRCAAILGRDENELRGAGLSAVMDAAKPVAPNTDSPVPEPPAQAPAWLRRALSRQGGAEFELPDGRAGALTLLAQISPERDHQGALTGYSGTFTDITERRRLEAEQMKVSQLESLGILAGGIAHDFRNLLTPILCNISLARLEQQTPEVRTYLGEAELAVKRTMDLTSQLLTFSRGGVPVREVVRLPELIQENVLLAMHGARSTSQVAIPRDLWSVEGDATQISQIVQNLIINAEQAMTSGGHISVTAENVQEIRHPALGRLEGRFVSIAFADNGPGIAAEHRARIFDPYFTTKKHGNGLGLATVYSIVKKHGGHIGLRTEAGSGTEFTIYLPASEKLPGVPRTAREAPARKGHGRILVMDDDEAVLQTLRHVLRHLGYGVETSQLGEEALELYASSQRQGLAYDAVIMDLTVRGGMGGRETMPKLLELDSLAKGIVASGYSDDPVVANFRQYGFCDVLTKPFTVHEVGRVLHRVVGGHPSVSRA